MLIPVRCYTCNKLIADKYRYYKNELLRKKLAMSSKDDEDEDENSKIEDTLSNISLSDNNNNNTSKPLNKKLSKAQMADPLIININAADVTKTIAGEIMDELGLHRICCRKVMLTSLDIIDEI